MTSTNIRTFAFLTATLFGLFVAANQDVASGQNRDQVPDFTQGAQIPAGATHDWNLGPTGARGWMFSQRMETSKARQILITKVADGSPSQDVLQRGDVILGVGDQTFKYDPRTELGKAITEAETEATDGRLKLIRWRNGTTDKIELRLPVLGSYSGTAPWNCSKSELVLERGLATLAKKIAAPSYRQIPITRSLNALALLASGREEYLPLVKKEAQWAAGFSTSGYKTWHYGYVISLLSEYVMATGDKSVLPGLKRLALEAAHGQSAVGSWGHRFTGQDGRLQGYGMMNAPGLPLTISLVLAREAGVDDPIVEAAIEKSARLIRFYVGKGSVPYGDHHPWIQTHEDNGKNGMAAVLFNLLGESESAEYFSRMSVASHGSERDTGHTGNFFNVTWALPGVAQSGPHASGAWMREFGSWYFDLARNWDGSFTHQGPPQERGDSYSNWDCTGAYLLAYAIPRGKLRLTGKGESCVAPIDPQTAKRLIDDGHGWSNNDRNSFYDNLNQTELLTRLGSWSPVVRERAAMALGRRSDAIVPQLIKLLSSKDLYTRCGACQALKMQRGRAAAAVPALREAFRADDLWLRIMAADALSGIGDAAKASAPDMLLRLTQDDPQDPRGMEQRYLSFALFNQRGGLLSRSLDGIDRELLLTAVRAGLKNQDGRARGSYASVYRNLSFAELQPLLPAIHEAIAVPAPSGIMFADTIRTGGLELFVKHRISEGIELLADYARNQKKHGSQKRIVQVMKMLEQYGSHAKRVVPHLEETAVYFETKETDFPRKLSLDKAKVVRETIKKIQSSTDTPPLNTLNR